jgi:GWxTD domain-containing protein
MKKTLALLNIAVSLIIFTGRISAAPKETRSLVLDADYAAFRIQGDTADAFVEIHYDLRRSQLKYEPLEKGYRAMIDFRLNLRDGAGNIMDSISWKGANSIDKLSVLDDTGYLISDMIRDKIPIGHYAVELFVSNGDRQGRASFAMDVPAFKNSGLDLSTLELAYQIKPDTSGKFSKNGLVVMPNPSGQYLRDVKKITVYAEGYGLDTTSAGDSVFYVEMQILTPAGLPVLTLPSATFQKPGESAVISTEFPIDTLKAGDYDLKMVLIDGGNSVSASRRFTIILPRDLIRQTILAGILRDFPEANKILTDEDATRFRDDIVYIATSDELKLFDSLNLTGKESFQKDFWDRRNPDPGSSQNAFENEHYRRLKYVKDTFGKFNGGYAGWRTDRGRVYIMYGEPSDIERYPQSLEARAWERWSYNSLEGGVYFIFVDMQNADDYSLIHSSKRDEIKDENWEDKIQMSANQR